MSAACRYLPAIFGACNWLWEMHSDARDGAPHWNDFVLFSIALNILMMMMMMHSIAYDVSERSYWNWVSNHIIYFSHFWANRWDWQILGLWTWCIWRCSSKHFDHFYFDIFETMRSRTETSLLCLNWFVSVVYRFMWIKCLYHHIWLYFSSLNQQSATYEMNGKFDFKMFTFYGFCIYSCGRNS